MTTDDIEEYPRKNVLRAQAYFEKRAGRPVSIEETERWLADLVDFINTCKKWQETADRDHRDE